MKKRLAKFSLLCAALLLAGLALALWSTREPVYQGRPLSAWMADLKSKTPEERKAAVEAVRAMGPEAAEHLAQELGQKPGILHRLNASLGPIVPERLKSNLRKVFNRGGGYMSKHAAADALKIMGTNGQSAIPALARALNGPDVVLSTIAGIALSEMHQPAVPALIEALNNPDTRVRGVACMALGKMGTNAAPAGPALVKLLQDEGGPILGSVSYSLSQIGAPVFADIKPLFGHTNWVVRRWALYAVEHMRPPLPDVYGEVIPLLADPHPEVRETALGALRQSEWHSPRLWQAVLFALEDHHTNVQARALQTMSGSPRLVMTNLDRCIGFLDSPAPNVRLQAANTIQGIGSHASNALPALARLTEDPDPGVRQKALQAFQSISNSVALKEIASPRG